METPQSDKDFTLVRRGRYRMQCREVSAEDVLALLGEAGIVMKQSRKSVLRRVGPCVIKSSKPGWAGWARLNTRRERYRRGFAAACHLEKHGIGVPRVYAYVEEVRLGFMFANHVVSEYLEGYRDSEQYLLRLTQAGVGKISIGSYLARLADAVNDFNAAGACHHDLSGKNIFTRDGENFVFIDMDDVTVGEPYTAALRLKNMVQLYDSFCDALSDAIMVPFITRMLAPEDDPRVWMPNVRKGQQLRRRMHAEKNPGAPRPLLPNQGDGGAGRASHS